MSLIAPVVDGKLQTSSTSSDSLAKSSNKSQVDSDTFLTLLVAEMQNQDPLEPTSNTEWVSQYATFTQVEQMTEMGESMDLLRANSMIGKEVVMKVTSESTGETSYKRGVVDYVTVEDGEALLVIDEEKYSISDLDSVASEEYFKAYDLYSEFVGMVDALPSLNLVDKSYENTIGKVYDLYSKLDEYQKNYINKYAAGYVSSYEAYIKKMEQLGITYGEEETTKKETTLDDVLNAFNKKMDALLTQISALNTTSHSSAAGSSSSGSASSGVTNVANNAAGGTQPTGNTSGNVVADATQSAGTASGNEASDATQSTGTASGNETSDATQSTGTASGNEASDATQSTGTASGNEASDATQSTGTASGSEVSDQTPSTDTASGNEVTSGTQQPESIEENNTADEPQPSDTVQGSSTVENTPSSDDTANGENTTENQEATETSGGESEATEDMLDQLTQDSENI